MNTNQRELTIDETSIFLSLHRANEKQMNEMFEGIISEGGWQLQVIEKRFKAHSLEVDKKTMVMILSLADGTVGKCANFVDDIAKICADKNINKISFDDFSKKIYPWGILSF
ncbi:MAG: hypothetical protein WCY77_10170 [Weeksellaceae bacterium]